MQVPTDELTDRAPSLIEYIVIHHSVAAQTIDIEDIARMEEAAQGFVTVGYNCYLKKIDHGWVLQEGRPLDKLPAAQYGMNEVGYAICIGGNYQPDVANVPTNTVDEDALHLAVQRILQVKKKAPNLKYLIGHRDVEIIKGKQDGDDPAFAAHEYGTSCPGDALYARLHDLRILTGLKSPPELL